MERFHWSFFFNFKFFETFAEAFTTEAKNPGHLTF